MKYEINKTSFSESIIELVHLYDFIKEEYDHDEEDLKKNLEYIINFMSRQEFIMDNQGDFINFYCFYNLYDREHNYLGKDVYLYQVFATDMMMADYDEPIGNYNEDYDYNDWRYCEYIPKNYLSKINGNNISDYIRLWDHVKQKQISAK